jgi:multiple sugar transport system substrate-binding protein
VSNLLTWLGPRRVGAIALTTALCTVASLTACGSNNESGSQGGQSGAAETITMWTLEDVQERIDATKKIAADYSAKTGNKVDVVAVAEDQFPQLITSAAAADNLPDVIAALGLSSVQDLAAKELLDPAASKEVVDKLGTGTFSERALKLTQDTKGNQLAVPSDGWAQLLLYRKDWFDQAGLSAPTTYDELMKAAAAMKTADHAGITLATAPADSFTQQTFEHLALANGCQLVDDAGNITLTSPNCVQTFQTVSDLAKKYGPAGNQDVDSTRAAYFAGKAAMTVWSSFILDEMAGLRKDALPTCKECRSDKQYLAKNTVIVSALKGPMGGPAQYGEITSFAITDGAADATKNFVQYMMNDAYLDWLALAPEGKVPVRKGTADDPTKFTNGWANLEAGVDSKAKLSSIYSPEVLKELTNSPDTFQRWGIEQGKGALAGAMLAELPVPKALSAELNGKVDAAGAAAQAQKDVEEINKGLE